MVVVVVRRRRRAVVGIVGRLGVQQQVGQVKGGDATLLACKWAAEGQHLLEDATDCGGGDAPSLADDGERTSVKRRN